MAVQVLDGLGADLAQLGTRVTRAIESQPEGLEYGPLAAPADADAAPPGVRPGPRPCWTRSTTG